LQSGNVVVNGNPVKQNYRVKPGDEISVLLLIRQEKMSSFHKIFLLISFMKMMIWLWWIKMPEWWFTLDLGIGTEHW
jgi:hypothetical protein